MLIQQNCDEIGKVWAECEDKDLSFKKVSDKYACINIFVNFRCNDVKVRSDLADSGLYVFSLPLYKLMLHIELLENFDFKWLEIGDDFIPFLARNQYKVKLNKLYSDA